MTGAEVVAVVADIVTAGALGIGAVVAVLGLRTWSNQLKGQTQFALARNVLRSTFKVRNAIGIVRHPMMSGGEISQAYRDAGEEPPTDIDKKADGFVYERRWTRLLEAQTDLEAHLVEAEVLWGPDVRACTTDVHRVVAELYAAIVQHVDWTRRPEIAERMDPEMMEEVRSKVYQIGVDSEIDAFSGKVTRAVQRVEDFLRPKLRL